MERWMNFPGAFSIRRRLHLSPNHDGIYKCPVAECRHEGFRSQRGCRKHITNSHTWYYYFDSYPEGILDGEEKSVQEDAEKTMKANDLSCNTREVIFAEKFKGWMCSATGGGRTISHANQICSRAIKFVYFSSEDTPVDISIDDRVDYYLGSIEHISNFIQHLDQEKSIGYAGNVSYISAMMELIEYRKFKGVSIGVLNNFSVAEIFLKRAKKFIARKMRVQWSEQLDVDTLERKGHWASLQDLQKVIPFHLERYKKILDLCKSDGGSSVTPADLTFATRFITTFLFLRVKGTRPMTYQFLTMEMLRHAKKNGGFIDQRKFKTAEKYGFDSLVIDDACMQFIDAYSKHVRPLLNPKCNFLLVNRNGSQCTRIHNAMGMMVYEAIGKYIHPTRYRQIIETESADNLTTEERDMISQDQKHTSNVARIHYQKKRSRTVAEKGNECIKKLRGDDGMQMDNSLHDFLTNASPESSDNVTCNEIVKIQPISSCNSIDNGNVVKDKRLLVFSALEDAQLVEGIKEHGYGKWSLMLKDKHLKFASGRTTNALLRRARTSKFQQLYKRTCGQTLL